MTINHSPFRAFTSLPGGLRAFLFFLLLFSFSTLSLFFPANSEAAGPLDAVHTAQRGIETADPDLFKQAVDVDSVLDLGFDQLIGTVSEQIRNGELEIDNPMLALAISGLGNSSEQNMQTMKFLLTSELRTLVNAGIRGGYFAGQPNGKAGNAGSFGSLLKNVSKRPKTLSAGNVLTQKDGEATISATLADGNKHTFPLRLRLERQGDQWQVKEVLNAAELLNEAIDHAD